MLSTVVTIFVAFLLVSKVESFECPNLTSCNCRRESDWSDSNTKSYNVMFCEGDFEDAVFNLSSVRNVNIKTLILKNVSLLNIASDTFTDVQVVSVKIVDSKAVIDKDAFAPIKSTIRHLSLINANIDKLWNLQFLKDLTELKSLVLDRNGEFPLHFPKDVFRNLRLNSLSSLSLRHCEITRMSDSAFAELSSLEILDLSYNKLSSVPVAISVLTNLKKFLMTNNKKLYYIHEHAFEKLTQLEEIDLSYSELDIIATDAFYGLENCLEILNVGHAKLPDGHFSSLRELKKLKHLDISYNRIVDMHNTSFEGFHALEELDISGQMVIRDGVFLRLNFIDSMFKGIERTLEILRISDLGLISLPLATLYPIENLQVLDASKNEFPELYENFFDGIKARLINLTDSGISEISSSAFESLIPGVTIIFDRNNITNISFILDTKVCLFRKLSFLENPVSCDCGVVNITATNRVKELLGSCADSLYRNEELRNLNKLELTKKTCGTHKYKRISHCLYINTGALPRLNTSLCGFYLICVLFVKRFVIF